VAWHPVRVTPGVKNHRARKEKEKVKKKAGRVIPKNNSKVTPAHGPWIFLPQNQPRIAKKKRREESTNSSHYGHREG